MNKNWQPKNNELVLFHNGNINEMVIGYFYKKTEEGFVQLRTIKNTIKDYDYTFKVEEVTWKYCLPITSEFPNDIKQILESI